MNEGHVNVFWLGFGTLVESLEMWHQHKAGQICLVDCAREGTGSWC